MTGLGREKLLKNTAGALVVAALAALPVTLPAAAATKIEVIVNNQPITSSQIKRRAAFFKLRRVKGNHRKLAREELIEEALRMQEARRLGRVVPDSQVDAAYANFAKRNRMPLKALGQILDRSGVTRRGFKKYIRAQMSWQAAVSLRARAEGRSTQKKGPLDHLHGPRKTTTGTTTEYTLQQVVFVVPSSKLKSGSNARTSEANNFRKGFQGCANTVAMAAKLKNVSVLKRGRTRFDEIPQRWRKELESTPEGRTTRPLKTEKGVELMAVCRTREVKSVKVAASDGDIFSQAAGGNSEIQALEKKYMEELRKVAVIKNR